MTTQTETLKLALEALEANQPVNYCMNNNGEKFPMMQEDPFKFERNTKAITAIKEALAQPEQESVAWRNAAIRVGEDLCSVGPFGYYDMTAEQWLDWALSVVTVHAPPPQRKPLVSLSDEDIERIAKKARSKDHAITLAMRELKEKNT